jgi:hypothetical protein
VDSTVLAPTTTDIKAGLLTSLSPWIVELIPIETGVSLPDTTLKFLALDWMRRHFVVVVCSPPVTPDIVAQNLVRKETARKVLGSLGGQILRPLGSGRVYDLSYAILPYCRPLSSKRVLWAVQRLWIRPRVLAWLREASRITMDRPSEDELEDAFFVRLRWVADEERLPDALRRAAADALRRLETGSWQPRVCLMHGDLWKGNVLLAPGSKSWRNFVLIDWPASLVRGYAFYDLVRLGSSMGLRGRSLARELRAHCGIFACDLIDARSYLMAAIGHIGMDLGEIPFEEYEKWAVEWLDYLRSTGA